MYSDDLAWGRKCDRTGGHQNIPVGARHQQIIGSDVRYNCRRAPAQPEDVRCDCCVSRRHGQVTVRRSLNYYYQKLPRSPPNQVKLKYTLEKPAIGPASG